MSVSSIGGFIRYVSWDGNRHIAVYSSLSNAAADAASINAAVTLSEQVVIGSDLVDTNYGLFKPEAALFVTPT